LARQPLILALWRQRMKKVLMANLFPRHLGVLCLAKDGYYLLGEDWALFYGDLCSTWHYLPYCKISICTVIHYAFLPRAVYSILKECAVLYI
jgi:hypothetical protein